MTRVSVSTEEVQGNAGSFVSAIRGDARFVAFESSASNLVPGDTNGASDIFVRVQLRVALWRSRSSGEGSGTRDGGHA